VRTLCFLLSSLALCPSALAQDACLGDAQPRAGGSVEERYRAARADYEAQRHANAAATFRALALDHADHEIGPYAASLYLDSLNSLHNAGNRACADAIAAAIDPLSSRYCGSSRNEELCRALAELGCQLPRLRSEALAAERRFREAAELLAQLARNTSCGRLDEVLFNAGLYYEAAGLRGHAIRVRTILISNFPDSRLAKIAQFRVGADHHAMANYAQAAGAYEAFARRYPGEDGSQCSDEQRRTGTCPVALTALETATFFRLGLGDLEAVRENVALFERNYRVRNPEATQRVALAYASALERAERWTELRSASVSFLRMYRAAPPDLALRAQSLAARAEEELGQRQAAAPYHEAIVRGYEDVVRAIERESAGDDDRALRIARVRDIAGRSMFRRTDEAAEALLAREAPAPSGDVARWAERSLAPWLTQQSESIRAISPDLERIASLEIPEWQIAAAERLGAIELHFASEVERAIAALPEEARAPLRTMFEPFRRRARERYEYCAITSVRVRWPSEPSARCHAALTELDPANFPPGPFELLGDYIPERPEAEPLLPLDPSLGDR
jgi:outer membrane protein assembly factor BamD (BamD/ComL family)